MATERMAQLDENSRPEDFYGREEAGVSPFFKSIAREIGDGPEGPCVQLKNTIKTKYLRARLSSLFKMTWCQFEREAENHGGSASWRPAFEEYTPA